VRRRPQSQIPRAPARELAPRVTRATPACRAMAAAAAGSGDR
jgi:hypothetical protein